MGDDVTDLVDDGRKAGLGSASGRSGDAASCDATFDDAFAGVATAGAAGDFIVGLGVGGGGESKRRERGSGGFSVRDGSGWSVTEDINVKAKKTALTTTNYDQ
jgi:hypothetical protein